MLTLGSLFDGIGGWCLAAEHTGIRPVWSSEIEKFPLAVTKVRFPYVKQLGDVTKIDPTKIEPVDIICAGSPCQDLSIAGKREGLAGERSGLFRTAISIVHRMRMYTGGRQPRFFIWENVPGAFSSNKGLDFRAVLEEIGQTEVPMPANGKWAENGVAQLPGCEIAWRVLDAVAWVPQRRKRIFLVADFGPGKPCAKEILFVEKSLRGNYEKGQCPGQEAAGSVTDGTGIPIVLRMRGGCDGGGKGALLSENRSLTLAANTNDQVVFSFDSLSSNSMKSANPNSGCRQVEIAKTLDTSTQDPSKNQGGIAVAFCIAGNMVDRETHQHGLGVSQNVSSTLTAADRHAVACGIDTYNGAIMGETACTLTSATGAPNTIGSKVMVLNDQVVTENIPNEIMSTTGGAVLDNEQSELYDKLCKGQGANIVSNGLERSTCTCSGKQIIGSLCAHDGRGFNGQDVANDKLIIEHYETDNDS